MNREYHKWYSPTLGRDMELLVFGHGGAPLIVFPTSMGRFFEYEERGMIGAVGQQYENGALQAFCVDSIDSESWYCKWAHPSGRAWRHMQYERYLLDEVLPFIRSRNRGALCATGCSFGGYHALNFALRQPEAVPNCVSMGGAFDIKQFLNGYYDENCYFNCPVDFMANMHDPWYLERYARMRIVLATGEWDICLHDNRRMSSVLTGAGVPHWLDVWGDGSKHDWPWWEMMARKYF